MKNVLMPRLPSCCCPLAANWVVFETQVHTPVKAKPSQTDFSGTHRHTNGCLQIKKKACIELLQKNKHSD
jgi:hypothetical protein